MVEPLRRLIAIITPLFLLATPLASINARFATVSSLGSRFESGQNTVNNPTVCWEGV
ncbi:MAG: hypothetical protein JRN24_01130 [Nitrososphaerota archaeon]|nr:hypothetical protein [Nitrososphaerota archaeon]